MYILSFGFSGWGPLARFDMVPRKDVEPEMIAYLE